MTNVCKTIVCHFWFFRYACLQRSSKNYSIFYIKTFVDRKEKNSHNKVSHCSGGQPPKEATEAANDDSLQSIKNLLRKVKNRHESRFQDILNNHTFIGWITRKFAVIQHNNSETPVLYKANMQNITEHLFYQLTLETFGKFGKIKLNPPPVIQELASYALDDVEESGWTEADGDKTRLAQYVSELLKEKSEMLSEYFSMDVTPDGRLKSIPRLLKGYTPFLGSLPNLLLRFATEVDWDDEEKCFDNLAREIGKFYAMKEDKESRYDTEQHSDSVLQKYFSESAKPVENTSALDPNEEWGQIFNDLVLPLIKDKLLLPKECNKDMTLVPMGNLGGKDYDEVVRRC